MANHRGSAFGAIGLGDPNSQKDFEAHLFMALQKYAAAPFLVVEGEGKRIGPVIVPDFLYEALQKSPHILLEAPLDVRVERIVAEYRGRGADSANDLAAAIRSLEKRLGQNRCAELIHYIELGDYESSAKTLCLEYYDRYYRDSRRALSDYMAVVDVTDISVGARQILAAIERCSNRAGS